jgi:hypothetical protein
VVAGTAGVGGVVGWQAAATAAAALTVRNWRRVYMGISLGVE